MTRRPVFARSWLVLLSVGACLPDFDVRTSRIDGPRLLAVRAEPAEARPGTHIDYELLAVTPRGRELSPAVRWSQCSVPKPSTENAAVSSDCYENPGSPLDGVQGFAASGLLPLDACARFGPDPPPGDARPRDPDGTGGFYQPIVLESTAGRAVHLQRLVCNPRSAPVDVARAFSTSYRSNQNPAPPTLRIGDLAPDSGDVVRATASDTLELELAWRLEDAEEYVWIDPVTSQLTTRHEALLVSWFATDGSLASDRSDVPEGDDRVEAANSWTAPARPGRVFLWAVLRDSRGGSTFVERAIDVE